MTVDSNALPPEERIKKQAKRLKKMTPGLSHSKALDQASVMCGFPDFLGYKSQLSKSRAAKATSPGLDFAAFRKVLSDKGIDFSVFSPSETGLKKSIIDATWPVRLHFLSEGFHDYSAQLKGPDHKVKATAFLVTRNATLQTSVSMYRPQTKDGDPRIWFSKLGQFAQPNDTIAIVFLSKLPHLINLSEFQNVQDLQWFLDQLQVGQDSKFQQLLAMLRTIARSGPISATVSGDTAVGMAVEAALMIKANSSRLPDYDGQIEIKAARKRATSKQTRQTLFAQVCEWGNAMSKYKSSGALLDRFGYMRGEVQKLYCTVSAGTFKGAHPQGLSLRIINDGAFLAEVHETEGIIAVWPMQLLIKRLLEKHSETVWIRASALVDAEGNESFELLSATHTKKPLTGQFVELIREGHITLDHLIKRLPNGAAAEKGPLFKISSYGFRQLFPDPVEYDLRPSADEEFVADISA